MRIAVAPNAFRGSLTALRATECIIAGLQRSNLKESLECVPMPLADGGDGTLDVLLHGLGGERRVLPARGPDGTPVNAEIGLLHGGTALIELARASGVELLPPSRRNPLITTTYGTGELIAAAHAHGCRHMVIGIGGSATVDGGAGCLAALGIDLLDAAGRPIGPGGGALADLARIDVQRARKAYADTRFTILCDVTNPLTGPDGAAHVFGPQKGADAAAVRQLDANLRHFAEIVRRDLGLEIDDLPGAGAAGGFSAGMVAAFGPERVMLESGGAALIRLLGYAEKLRGVDLVITGEGKLDSQTSGGKAVQRIAEAAAVDGIPVIALAGLVDADPMALAAMGIGAAWSIVPGPTSLEAAVANAEGWLVRAATQLGNTLGLLMR